MTTVWTARQRRVPRALVHRARPQGWAHVTCDRERKQSLKTSEPAASRSPGGRGRRQPHTRVVWQRRYPLPPPAPPAPPANRSPGGRGRRQPHTRAVWAHLCHPPPPRRQGRRSHSVVSWDDERRVPRSWAKGGDAFEWDECAAGAARALPGCGWQLVPGAVVAGDNDAPERHECAAGAARALPGCGWQLVHSSSATVFSRDHKLRAPSPVASIDAQVREGPGAAVRHAWPFFVHTCAALGPGAAVRSQSVVTRKRWCSDGRARSLTNV
jgi:hypothetical protein